MDTKQFIATVYKACQEVATALQSHPFEMLIAPHSVGHGGDMSIGADLLSERILIDTLSPFGAILSEERGHCGLGEYLILIDPIDGSDNFKSRFPYYGISIALLKDNVTLCGVVCNLASGEFIYRIDGDAKVRNLYRDDASIRLTCNAASSVGLFEKAPKFPEVVEGLDAMNLKFRSPGAVALSLAYAPYVKYVLFLGTIREYDVAAGLHICKDHYCYRDAERLIVSKERDVYIQLLTLLKIDVKDTM